MNHVITLYTDELMLKGANRPYFERALIDDIKARARNAIEKGAGKFILRIAHDKILETARTMQKVPGISNINVGVSVESKIEKIREAAIALMGGLSGTFKIDVTRSDKRFPLNSVEVARDLGRAIQEKYGYAVDLKNPEHELTVQIDSKESFISRVRLKGMGGLPLSTAGRVVALISGGIDSPVAAWMMMRRGAEVVGVHFENETTEKTGVKDKIAGLERVLEEYQPSFKILTLPFGDIQRRVVMGCPADLRMLVYRRIMFTIAERVAGKINAKAIVTGDSLSQVASQTLENLNVLYNEWPWPANPKGGPRIPVFAPLIGMNKAETVRIAREIGTYEVSILPFEDCCSMFIATHPKTRATLQEVQQVEAGLDIDEEIIINQISNIKNQIWKV